jgi:hypothetical protein
MNPALVLAGEPIQVPLYRLREGRAVRPSPSLISTARSVSPSSCAAPFSLVREGARDGARHILAAHRCLPRLAAVAADSFRQCCHRRVSNVRLQQICSTRTSGEGFVSYAG